MHGDGWQLKIDEKNWVTFFPYAWGWLADECEHSVIAEVFPCAWGWLETNKENTEESVFPLCVGMIGPGFLVSLKLSSTSPMCGMIDG